MPLIKSKSKAAVSANIKSEISAGKPQAQAVAIALDTQRRARRAKGGDVPPLRSGQIDDYGFHGEVDPEDQIAPFDLPLGRPAGEEFALLRRKPPRNDKDELTRGMRLPVRPLGGLDWNMPKGFDQGGAAVPPDPTPIPGDVPEGDIPRVPISGLTGPNGEPRYADYNGGDPSPLDALGRMGQQVRHGLSHLTNVGWDARGWGVGNLDLILSALAAKKGFMSKRAPHVLKRNDAAPRRIEGVGHGRAPGGPVGYQEGGTIWERLRQSGGAPESIAPPPPQEQKPPMGMMGPDFKGGVYRQSRERHPDEDEIRQMLEEMKQKQPWYGSANGGPIGYAGGGWAGALDDMDMTPSEVAPKAERPRSPVPEWLVRQTEGSRGQQGPGQPESGGAAGKTFSNALNMAIGAGQLGGELTGIPTYYRGLDELSKAQTPMDYFRGATKTAVGAAPGLGLIRTMPQALGLGVLGAAPDMLQAGMDARAQGVSPDDRIRQYTEDRVKAQARRDKYEREMNAEEATSKGPKWRGAKQGFDNSAAEVQRLDGLIEMERKTPAYVREQAKRDQLAKQDLEKQETDRPWRERNRTLSSNWPWIVPTIAAGTAALTVGGQKFGRYLHNVPWRSAVDEAKTLVGAGATKATPILRELKEYNKTYKPAPSGPGWLPGAVGGGLGAELGAYPIQSDIINLGWNKGVESPWELLKAGITAGLGITSGATAGKFAHTWIPESRAPIESSRAYAKLLSDSATKDARTVAGNLEAMGHPPIPLRAEPQKALPPPTPPTGAPGGGAGGTSVPPTQGQAGNTLRPEPLGTPETVTPVTPPAAKPLTPVQQERLEKRRSKAARREAERQLREYAKKGGLTLPLGFLPSQTGDSESQTSPYDEEGFRPYATGGEVEAPVKRHHSYFQPRKIGRFSGGPVYEPPVNRHHSLFQPRGKAGKWSGGPVYPKPAREQPMHEPRFGQRPLEEMQGMYERGDPMGDHFQRVQRELSEERQRRQPPQGRDEGGGVLPWSWRTDQHPGYEKFLDSRRRDMEAQQNAARLRDPRDVLDAARQGALLGGLGPSMGQAIQRHLNPAQRAPQLYNRPLPEEGWIGFKAGGAPDQRTPSVPHSAGPVEGRTGGRADALNMTVEPGAYVVPAHVVSNLPGAEGNTGAGMGILTQHFGPAQRSPMAQSGVPIKISAGEYVLSPEQVAKVGGGDIAHGHRVLDALCRRVQMHAADTIRKLPPPSK